MEFITVGDMEMKDINKKTLTAGKNRILSDDLTKDGALRWRTYLQKSKEFQMACLVMY